MGAPKINIYREPPDVRQVTGQSTTVWYVVCVCERGPVGVPTLCTSDGERRRIFGNYLASPYYGPLSMSRALPAKGNKRFWINRIVHFTLPNDVTTATSAASTYTIQSAVTAPTSGSVTGSIAGPWDLEPGDTIHVVTDAVNTTCTFAATAAARQNGIDEVFALTSGWTLTLKIDEDLGGTLQTIEFLTAEFIDIANATAEEVAAVIAAKITGAQVSVTGAGKRVTITSDTRGDYSGVNIVGGLANGALQFTAGLLNGTGNVVAPRVGAWIETMLP